VNAPTLTGIFLVFLKMGATAFGGNVALVASIKKEICDKRKWMKDDQILDLMAIGNLLPGPLATNVVFAIGKILAGFGGAMAALIGVCLPSFLLMCALSWAYFTYGNAPAITSVMNGIIPGVAGVIASVAWTLLRKNVSSWQQYLILILAGTALFLWKGFFLTLIIVVAAAVAGRFLFYKEKPAVIPPKSKLPVAVWALPAFTILVFAVLIFFPHGIASFDEVRKVALAFGTMSLTLFGGGYVFVPAMENVVVHELHWMTVREFTNGIALGHATPGPIMVSCVFVGWKVAGWKGATAAIIMLFGPPAVMMYTAHHFISRIKSNATAEAMFKGVRPAVIGMIFASVWVVFSSAPLSVWSFLIFAITFALTTWKNPEPVLLIIGSAVAGWLLF
jgi:chromate transporter